MKRSGNSNYKRKKEDLEYVDYPYQLDNDEGVTPSDIKSMIEKCKELMKGRCKRMKLEAKSCIRLWYNDQCFVINDGIADQDNRKTILNCYVPTKMLIRILKGEAFWNNAEIGCHIQFERIPDSYDFDAHMMLQLFHG